MVAEIVSKQRDDEGLEAAGWHAYGQGKWRLPPV
jgi:hypothetical protein